MNQERVGLVSRILDEMVETGFVAGVSCLILEKGKEIGYFESGYADLKTKQPFKRDTICRMFSMTKPITAAAMMLLMEQGKIDLLDPVEKYIPSFKGQCVIEGRYIMPCQKPVTIKDLLSMTSGILYHNDQEVMGLKMDTLFEEIKAKLRTSKAYTTYEVATAIGELPLAFQPGTHWVYGASADVLGAIVEVVTNKTFGTFLRENLWIPLEMVDTDFWVPDEKRHRLATAYEQTEKGLVEYQDNGLGILNEMDEKPCFESGGAGLASTIDDYSHFTQMLLNKGTYNGKRILAPKTIEYMTSCELPAALNRDVASWDSLRGHSYGNLMRILSTPELAIFNGTKGEYGWDGWLGTYFSNDPVHEISFIMMQQRINSGTTEYTRKVRNVLSAAIE